MIHRDSDLALHWAESPPRVLVVDDEEGIRDILAELLALEGFAVQVAPDGQEALRELDRAPYDLLLCDLKMPGLDGVQVLRRLGDRGLKVVMMTGYGTVEAAVEAMKLGAVDFLLKPFRPDDVLQVLRRAAESQRIERENLALRETLGFFELSQTLVSNLPLEHRLAVLVDQAKRNLEADGVTLITIDPDVSGPPSITHSAGMPFPAHGLAVMLGRLQAGQPEGYAVSAGQVVETFGDILPPGTSVATAPLRVRGRLLGVIVATATRPHGEGFRAGQRKGLAVFADRAADALDSARMYASLERNFTETIESFSRAIEAKDPYTAGHSDRVADYASLIARSIGMGPEDVRRVRHGGLLHDIGKIGINLSILNKPGRLTMGEYERFKSHTAHGKRIVEPISFLTDLVPFIYSHHESYSGRGYPNGLGGLDIPLAGRITAIADSYDAMTSDRAYRKALPHAHAVAELVRCSGTQFDAGLARVFVENIEDFRRERVDQGLSNPV